MIFSNQSRLSSFFPDIKDEIKLLNNQIEATISAENDWMNHVEDVASNTLRYSCNSWYVGANVPGKKRVFMPYIGGQDIYRNKCKEISNNNYQGFVIS